MFLLFITLLHFSHSNPLSIHMKCDVCEIIPDCKECFVFNGDPLKNVSICADTSGGCRILGSQSVLTFGCDCKDEKCSYSIIQGSYVEQGCANDDDPDWAYTQFLLDSLLLIQNGEMNQEYDWCRGACSKSRIPVFLWILLALVIITIIVGVINYRKEKMKQNGQRDNNESYQLV